MDCSTFRNFCLERERLCKSHSTPSGKAVCDNCELNALEKLSQRRYCPHRCMEFPDEAIKIVQKWSDNNKIKTRKSEFLKLFPKAGLEDGEYPTVCAGDIFGFACPNDTTKGKLCTCKECWNTSVEGAQ